MALSPNSRVGPYEVLSPIGAGGMGEVYAARDTRLLRNVALKIVPPELLAHPAGLARFRREAEAVAALHHDNVIDVYDVSMDGDVPFVVFELLEGETLRSRLRRSAMKWREAAEIAIKVCEGIAAAHQKGITHRDLKPENIFLTNDNGVKVLDFGLARQANTTGAALGSGVETLAASLTQEATVLGTPAYMSPEQVRGDTADTRSDIFAIGCVLYEMVAGRAAFSHETAVQTMAAIIEQEPPGLKQTVEIVPAELEALIANCLAKNRERRFQSAHDLSFTLQMILRREPPGKPRATRSPWLVGAAVLSMLLLAAVAGWSVHRRGDGQQLAQTIAILPFINTEQRPGFEYLIDGMAESITDSLANAPRLAVRSSNSVFRLKGKDIDPGEAGRLLNVETVVTGRIIERNGSLFVNVELIHVKENRRMWGSSYQVSSGDILSLQENISGTIAKKLGIDLSGEEQSRIRRRYTDDIQAYRSYLQGRYYYNNLTPESLQLAIRYFQQAIDRDSRYALAYAGISDAYAVLAFYGSLSPAAAYSRAHAAALKAVELEDALAEAHTALAHVKMNFTFDWSGAEKELRRAIQLNSNYSTAHNLYSVYLIRVGRFQQALQHIHLARDIDPFSININTSVGLVLYFMGSYDEAIEQMRETLEMDKKLVPARIHLAWCYERKGKLEQAVTELEQARLMDIGSATIGDLGRLYATTGRIQEARRILESMDPGRTGSVTYVSPFDTALVHLGLGQRDLALTWLERAYEERAGWLGYMMVDPRLAELRSEQRFQALARQMGLVR